MDVGAAIGSSEPFINPCYQYRYLGFVDIVERIGVFAAWNETATSSKTSGIFLRRRTPPQRVVREMKFERKTKGIFSPI